MGGLSLERVHKIVEELVKNELTHSQAEAACITLEVIDRLALYPHDISEGLRVVASGKLFQKRSPRSKRIELPQLVGWLQTPLIIDPVAVKRFSPIEDLESPRTIDGPLEPTPKIEGALSRLHNLRDPDLIQLALVSGIDLVEASVDRDLASYLIDHLFLVKIVNSCAHYVLRSDSVSWLTEILEDGQLGLGRKSGRDGGEGIIDTRTEGRASVLALWKAATCSKLVATERPTLCAYRACRGLFVPTGSKRRFCSKQCASSEWKARSLVGPSDSR